MSLFRTRTSAERGSEASARKNTAPVDTVETLRTRARQRLIGASVLVVLGIVTFAWLFDKQPRPIPTDIEIIIPDKDKSARLEAPVPAQTSTQTPVVTPPQLPTPAAPVSAVAPSAIAPATNTASPSTSNSSTAAAVTASPALQLAPAKVAASASLYPKEELVNTKTAPKPEAKLDLKTDPKPVLKSEPKSETKPAAKTTTNDDSAKAKAILEGKDPKALTPTNNSQAPSAERFIVQVGAFADANKAREVRLKVERAGLKTYTHVAKTPEGTRTRVRVGPFASRAEADKAAEKIKQLDLPAAILTL